MGRNMHNLSLSTRTEANICVCGKELDTKSLTGEYVVGNFRYHM